MPPTKLLGNLLGTGAGSLIEKIGNVVDKFVTTKQEKAEAVKQLQEVVFNHEVLMDQEITKRHVADMASDSWLSKNIRPMTLIFILLMYSFFSLFDGNLPGNFHINPAYVQLLGQWGMLIMSFYFGSRGLEKITSIVTNKMFQTRKEQKEEENKKDE